MPLIAPLQGLLAPYIAAMAGTPTPIGTGMSSDPLMAVLLSSLRQGGGAGAGAIGSVPAGTPGAGTDYPYRSWEFPFALDPNSPLLDTRRGVTLQQGPLRSLIDIARQSNILPGAREVGRILQGYRPLSAQQAGYAQSPGRFAQPGRSYHGQGLAIDAGWWSGHPELARLLRAAGWNQLPSEDWHWSYGVSG